MIQSVLKESGGIAIYGVISGCLFFFVFGAAMIWALLHKKAFLKSMSVLPLEDGTKESKGDNSNE